MKDYTVTITVETEIRAKSEEQAHERAELLETAVAEGLGAVNKPWLGDIQAPESEVEEQS